MKNKDFPKFIFAVVIIVLLLAALFMFLKNPSNGQKSVSGKIQVIENRANYANAIKDVLKNIEDDIERSNLLQLHDYLQTNHLLSDEDAESLQSVYLKDTIVFYHYYRSLSDETVKSEPYENLSRMLANTGTGRLYLINADESDGKYYALHFYEFREN